MNPPCAVMLRPARAGEARTLAEMSRTLIEAGLGWRYTPRRMASLIADPDAVALVAHDGSQIQGFAVMQFGDEEAHLVLLCVRPALRKRGIGRCLAEWLLESARVAGIATIGLELRADNPAALAFYRQLGFSQTQQLAGYYDQRVDARRMTLRLRAAAP